MVRESETPRWVAESIRRSNGRLRLKRRPRWERVLRAPLLFWRQVQVGAGFRPLRWRVELAARLVWLSVRE